MGSRRGNGLVLLYEAAMLLEQQQQQQQQQQQRSCVATKVCVPTGRPVTYRASTVFKSPDVAKRLPPTLRVSRPPGANRSSHNELEKSRRAHLRQCLDSLRDQLPLGQGEASRLTMLNVLKKSFAYLRELESVANDQRSRLRQQERRRQELLHRRSQLLRRSRSGGKTRRVAVAAADAAAAVLEAWRSRNVSEISVASASSDDTELASMAAQQQQKAPAAGRRGTVCSSPDSGYASPPACAT